MTTASETYLRRKDAAAYLQERCGAYTAQTLAKLACIGGGPTYRKMGRTPLYTIDDLEAWIASRMSGPIENTAQA